MIKAFYGLEVQLPSLSSILLGCTGQNICFLKIVESLYWCSRVFFYLSLCHSNFYPYYSYSKPNRATANTSIHKHTIRSQASINVDQYSSSASRSTINTTLLKNFLKETAPHGVTSCVDVTFPFCGPSLTISHSTATCTTTLANFRAYWFVVSSGLITYDHYVYSK